MRLIYYIVAGIIYLQLTFISNDKNITIVNKFISYTISLIPIYLVHILIHAIYSYIS